MVFSFFAGTFVCIRAFYRTVSDAIRIPSMIGNAPRGGTPKPAPEAGFAMLKCLVTAARIHNEKGKQGHRA
ncbi:hypothetical protein F3J19_17905 [Burkholderia sp. Ax-1724]|nr:hypothetical protein [Burkholderia sp. Ax-1724]